jgi:hypothetical protein
MKRFILSIFIFLSGLTYSQAINYKVEQIWSNGQHCAFTSLIEFKGKYYCTFREGYSHIFDNEGNAEGKIRILASKNGKKWESVALIGKDGYDLRDPKFSITPDGRLMVSLGGSIYRNRKLVGAQSHVMFSEDGKRFTEPIPVVIDPQVKGDLNWIWRVTWHKGVGYGMSYDRKNNISLLRTEDGIDYSLIKTVNMEGFPNETTIRFDKDDTMWMMIRRDKGDRKAKLATSRPPYSDWEYTDLPMFVGGPDFLIQDGLCIAGGRAHETGAKPKTVLSTDLFRGGPQITLPSGGDTSYPGLMVVGNELWVSYYSTHETPKASIYLAKIPISYLKSEARSLKQNPETYAHRGCWFKGNVPENSLEAVRMAKRFGYKGIECDVKYTSDSVMVIMHDKTINRTMRNASDYSRIENPVEVSRMPFKELRDNYVMASDNPEMRERIPTLEELLQECRTQGMVPMLHSNIAESFEMAQKIMGDGNWIAFSGDYKAMKKAREITGGLILYSVGKGAVIDDVLSRLDTIGKPCGISTMKHDLLTKDFNNQLVNAGYQVQASIFRSPFESYAHNRDITIQLSDFCVVPEQNLKTVDKWHDKKISLKADDTCEKSWKEMEYGAIILNIKAKGNIKITVNDSYHYLVDAPESFEDRYIGIRFHKTAPKFKIAASEDSIIKNIEVLIQRPE